jgi:hypothetical protein
LHPENDYHIEKTRCPVGLTTVGGERIVGEIFVQAYSRHPARGEAPSDILNDDAPFFPVAVRDGATLLVAKEHVRDVEVGARDDGFPDVFPGVIAVPVELALSGGGVRAGRIYVGLPYDRPRLLDYLNRYTSRFLTLHTDEGLCLVNRRAIERVRPLD